MNVEEGEGGGDGEVGGVRDSVPKDDAIFVGGGDGDPDVGGHEEGAGGEGCGGVGCWGRRETGEGCLAAVEFFRVDSKARGEHEVEG